MNFSLPVFSLALTTLLAFQLPDAAFAQNWQHPAVPRYGDVVEVEEPVFAPAPDRLHRVAFDLAGREDKDGVNVSLWYLARLRNLYALAGVPADSLDIVGVLHGGATTLALSTEAAAARGLPLADDLDLLHTLAGRGVRFVVCAQSAAGAEIDLDTQLNPDVVVGLSAMTTLLELKHAGYVTP